MTAGPATLDDAEAVRAADPSGMLELVSSLGGQLREGYRAALQAPNLPPAEGVRSIVVTGMGGSGVAGDILRSLCSPRLSVPVLASKAATLPAFCDASTLVVAVSFSGHTEETEAAFRRARDRGCRIVLVSSGGALGALAGEHGVPWVLVPGSIPAPRAALGYLAGAPIGILDAMGVIGPADGEIEEAAGALDELAGRWGPGERAPANLAKAMAGWLGGRIPVVWGSEGLAEAAAVRWKTQFNENAKTPAFCSVLPELDHNEVEGWAEGTGGPFGLVVLRHPGEHPRTGPRVEASLRALAGSGIQAREARVEATAPMAALFSLILLGDFTSTYLAIGRGVDPMPVPVLTSLKERLRG